MKASIPADADSLNPCPDFSLPTKSKLVAVCNGLAVFLSFLLVGLTTTLLLWPTGGSEAATGLGLVPLPSINLYIGSYGEVYDNTTLDELGELLYQVHVPSAYTTSADNGITITLSTTSSSTSLIHQNPSNTVDILATSGTWANPAPLDMNTWGYGMLAEADNNFSLSWDDLEALFEQEYPDAGDLPSEEMIPLVLDFAARRLEYVAIAPSSAPQVIVQTDGSENPGTVGSIGGGIIFFAFNAGPNIPPDTYTQTIRYTAFTNTGPNFIQAPSITSISPDVGPTGGGTQVTIVGTNFTKHDPTTSANDYSITTAVTVGGNPCTSVSISSRTPTAGEDTITCNVAAHAAGAVDVVVDTWYGTPVTATNGFTYQDPSVPTAQWVKAANTNAAAISSITGTSVSNITVGLDTNMIPVVNKDSNGSYPANWCNYDTQQWCNAVTVKPSALAAYQADPMGAEIAEADILGYWVYIPRFAYEVQRYSAWNRPVCGNNQTGTNYADADCTSNAYQARFDIHFEKATDTKKIPSPGSSACSTPPASALAANLYTGGTDYRTGCGVSRTYGAATGTTWATHPAFTFGSTELDGIWVGKFETTGSIAAPTVKPNLKSQISQTPAPAW